MAKQTFVTGQVLTAAQMNTLQLNDYNQTVSAKTASYVLVAADAGTLITMNAAGATTITVNTALFASGDTLKITNIGAGVTTITAGTATVSTSGVLTLAQYASGVLYFTSTGVAIFNGSAAAAASGGMTLLSTTAITNVAQVSITGIDQTYNQLVVVIANAATVSTGVTVNMRANTTAAGVPYSSVFTAGSGVDFNAVANNIQLNSGATNPVTMTANTNNITAVVTIPRYTDVTPVKVMQFAMSYLDNAGTLRVNTGTATTREAAAITSLQFYLSAGNWTAQGNIYIYGVK